jgi:hypothetical protein
VVKVTARLARACGGMSEEGREGEDSGRTEKTEKEMRREGRG